MTNGDWKDSKKIVSDFKKLKYFTGFCFSIHGATKWSHKIFTGNDNYEKLIKNIKLAVKEKFTVITNTVLGENNKSEIKDLILLLKDLKVSSMFFSRYIGCLRQGISFYRDDMKKITDYFAEIEKIMPVIHLSNCFPQCFTKTDSNCKAGIDHYHIDCKGNLKFCAFSESIFGNLLNKKASEILKSSKAKSWINHIPKACKSCDIISACKGGCKTLIEILGITKDPLMTKPVEIVKKINKR
jgi:radical SAM protein with 4Fe4S-binding SPASM domain